LLNKRLNSLFSLLGPGLIYAAAAVGVSHLVQSTRAGASYGLSLIPLFILISLLKYPAFRFATQYAAITGKPLSHYYLNRGIWGRLVLVVGIVVDFFISCAAVALVTAGLLKNALGLGLPLWLVSFLTVAFCGALLIHGQYRLFEKITGILVILFSLMTVVASLLAVGQYDGGVRELLPSVPMDTAVILLLIAMAGWMPTPLSVSFYLSSWSAKKKEGQTLDPSLALKKASFDFSFGYSLTVVLALFFIGLGALVLFGLDIQIAKSAGGFSEQLISVYASVIGSWSRPIIAGAAIAVMLSTVYSLMDGCCRSASDILSRQVRSKYLFSGLLLLQIIGVTLIIYSFTGSFKAFIDFATRSAFVAAPFIAYFNYKALFSNEVDLQYQPGKWMRNWSLVSVLGLSLFSLAYFYFSFFGKS